MQEIELKGAVADLPAVVARLEALGARRDFVGEMDDRRLDLVGDPVTARGEIVRLRSYRADGQFVHAALEWKGPASRIDGYKVREELSAGIVDSRGILEILSRAGFRVVHAIDRTIWQYTLDDVVVRLERYPRMDDLIEIEGEPAAIERVVERLGLDRASLGSDSLVAFVDRYEAATGARAVLSRDDAAGNE